MAGLISATHSNVAASATTVALFTASTNAVEMRSVFNDSTATLYLKYGATASTTSHAVQVAPGGYFEFPMTRNGVWPGAVEGIWSSATGSARCVEMS
jgi:hypothetical protein